MRFIMLAGSDKQQGNVLLSDATDSGINKIGIAATPAALSSIDPAGYFSITSSSSQVNSTKFAWRTRHIRNDWYQIWGNLSGGSTTMSLTHYITAGGFYGYWTNYFSIPVTIAYGQFYPFASWQVGNSHAMPATVLPQGSIPSSGEDGYVNKIAMYVLSNVSGTQKCKLSVYIIGKRYVAT